ncbi:hypothetical protein NQZ68_025862 [Dissostichus eleginoides]|nr:hypothetical protein NQZ68_025862 [Dissostichus eleginoides]
MLTSKRKETAGMGKGDDEGTSVIASALKQRWTGRSEKGNIGKVKAEGEEREEGEGGHGRVA